MKNKKKLIGLATVGVLGIAVTFAAFTSNFSVSNVFKSGKASATFEETFKSPKLDETVYGKTFEKSGKIVNTGDVAVTAKAKISVIWKNTTGDAPDNTITGKLIAPDDNEYAVTLNFGDTIDQTSVAAFKTASGKFDVTADVSAAANHWVYDADGYFYYGTSKTALTSIGKNESSTPLLKSVTFNDKLGTMKSDTYYYAVNGTGANEKVYGKDGNLKAADHSNSFDSQEEATAFANKTENASIFDDYQGVRVIVVNTLTNTAYADRYLVVTIDGTVTEVNK